MGPARERLNYIAGNRELGWLALRSTPGRIGYEPFCLED